MAHVYVPRINGSKVFIDKKEPGCNPCSWSSIPWSFSGTPVSAVMQGSNTVVVTTDSGNVEVAVIDDKGKITRG